MKKLSLILAFGLALTAFGCGDDSGNKDSKDNSSSGGNTSQTGDTSVDNSKRIAAEKSYIEAVLACAADNGDVGKNAIDEFKNEQLVSELFPLCSDSVGKYFGCIAGTGCEMLLEVAFDLNELSEEEWDALVKKSGAEKCETLGSAMEQCVVDKYYKDEYAFVEHFDGCVEDYNKANPDDQLDEEFVDGYTSSAFKLVSICPKENNAYFKCLSTLPCKTLLDDAIGEEENVDFGECEALGEALWTCFEDKMGKDNEDE